MEVMMKQNSSAEQQNDNVSVEKQKTCSDMGKIGGPLGGRARAKKLSAKRRSDIARQGGNAKWAKKRKEKILDNA